MTIFVLCIEFTEKLQANYKKQVAHYTKKPYNLRKMRRCRYEIQNGRVKVSPAR